MAVTRSAYIPGIDLLGSHLSCEGVTRTSRESIEPLVSQELRKSVGFGIVVITRMPDKVHSWTSRPISQRLGATGRLGRYFQGMQTTPTASDAINVTANATAAGAAPELWSRRTRWIVSLLLIWHVTAVFVGPAAVDPTSGLMLNIFSIYRPYLDALYLNHGYHFFAPEPGPSHLIRYEMTQQDGTTKTGYFPNRQDHWPRLRYHRHFMLTEHLAQFAEEGVPPEYLQSFSESYARHLLAEHQGQQVKLILVRHLFPTPQQVLDGATLTDQKLYFERNLGSFQVATEELPQPN